LIRFGQFHARGPINSVVRQPDAVCRGKENMDRRQYCANKLKEFTSYVKPLAPRYLSYGIALEALAWLLLPIGLVVLAFLNLVLGLIITGIIFVVLLTQFFKIRRLAKRYRFNAIKRLQDDSRCPVLYLRSFLHDQTTYSGRRDRSTPEEFLVSVFNNIGPVVAVGSPGEELAPLGAIRVYFRNEEWKEKVQTLMSISEFVVINAGYSTGLEWEMATAAQHVKPERLLISFAFWHTLKKSDLRTAYEVFKMQATRILGVTLPDNIENILLIYFNHEWKPGFIRLGGWKKFFYGGISAPAIRESLRPFLKERGIKLGLLGTSIYIGIVLLLTAVIAYLLIGFLLMMSR
jgi:hypothetical protein